MEGIRKFAGVMSIMQETRGELLQMGSLPGNVGTSSVNQDLRLAQLLDDAKDAVKEEFCKVTMQETNDNSNHGTRHSSRQK